VIEEDAPVRGGGEEVLYDYLKHVTSLCLFSLAGVAALADKVQGHRFQVVAALIAVGAAAFSSFIATGLVMDARVTGQPVPPSFRLYRHAAPLLLSVGIGAMLYVFVRSRG
jgi:hypothetical protein